MKRSLLAIASVLAFIGLALAAVLLAHELVAASGSGLRWPTPGWWRWLVDPAHRGRATLTGSAACVVAAVLLGGAALALRRSPGRQAQVGLPPGSSPAPSGEGTIAAAPASVAPPAESVAVRLEALEHLLDARLAYAVAELSGPQTTLRHAPDGFAAVVLADAVPVDLLSLQRRAAELCRGRARDLGGSASGAPRSRGAPLHQAALVSDPVLAVSNRFGRPELVASDLDGTLLPPYARGHAGHACRHRGAARPPVFPS